MWVEAYTFFLNKYHELLIHISVFGESQIEILLLIYF